MDSAMRDLEQIRERDEDGEGRPLALVGLLILVTMGLVFAMGSLVGWTDDTDAAEEDPLARLDRASGLVAVEETDETHEAARVDRASLTFPSALGPPHAERADVALTIAAARAELDHPDPLEHLPPLEPAAPSLAEALPAIVPTAVAAGPSHEALLRTVESDPLVASSITVPQITERAEVGQEGPYTLQVISVPDPAEAETFATGLRARGHRAFVMQADVEGRGTMYRVRIGPFETQRAADTFRAEFERTERMNTLVVRRRDTET